ncbi:MULTISPECIES: hypothetical protein [unclassified Streptomyces]|uniref:hypothetical protein n=1 Tax=unclassified Streptomyces TaxID=2593676 RepID=UPI0003777839|nr:MULTISPECIES: hypothetical protein [unclassified Streptomyces]MYT33725.1 hypothetical protein [Streptomyces sp. SID8354]
MSRIRTAAAALALAAFVSVLAVNTGSNDPEDSGWGATLAGADDSGWGSAPLTTDIRPAGTLRI